jgi:hypothetical protein
VLLAFVLVPAAAFAAASGSGQVWAINCLREQYKPQEIVIACGDGGVLLRHLRWTSWTRSKAKGAGDYSQNDCNPSCVSGHFHSYAVKVTLSMPVSCPKQKHRAFRRVNLSFSTPPPKGTPRQLSLLCP